MSKKHFNFKSSIRDWYIRAFPSDELGYRINPLATFAGAVKCMADGGDIYKYLGVGDSLVRENVFSKIAAITGVDFDAVYDLWSHHDEDESSRLVFLGDHPDCAVDRDWREQFDEVVSPSEQVRYDEMLAAEEHRKAETFDSFMEVNEIPMDEVRSAGIALMLMQGIVFAEIAKKIDGPSEELDERIATFNRDLKRLYNEPLHKKVEQIESQVGKLEEKAAIYDEMRYIAEHTDPADIRIAEGSTSMTGALMAAAMASYDLSCGLIDDEHIGRYSDVITALEERMGVGAGGLSVQTEAGELIANAKEDGISVGITPGGVRTSASTGVERGGLYFYYDDEPKPAPEFFRERHSKTRPIVCLETGETFMGNPAAARPLHVSPAAISQAVLYGSPVNGLHFYHGDEPKPAPEFFKPAKATAGNSAPGTDYREHGIQRDRRAVQ